MRNSPGCWRSCVASRVKPLSTIDQANQEALRRILAGDPVLVDVVPASEAIPDLGERMILHAGPPIGWDRMCGPMRGAVMGIAVFEGWAKDLDDAAQAAAAGAFAFHPNHHFGAVGPMTGMTTREPAPDGGGEQGLRQSRVLRDQRRPRQGDAVRRQRRRGAEPPALDPRGPRTRARTRDPRVGRHSAQAVDRARAHHGRRDASAQRRLLEPARCASSRRFWRAPPPIPTRSPRASTSSAATISSSSTSRWRWARRSPIRREESPDPPSSPP